MGIVTLERTLREEKRHRKTVWMQEPESTVSCVFEFASRKRPQSNAVATRLATNRQPEPKRRGAGAAVEVRRMFPLERWIAACIAASPETAAAARRWQLVFWPQLCDVLYVRICDMPRDACGRFAVGHFGKGWTRLRIRAGRRRSTSAVPASVTGKSSLLLLLLFSHP